MAEGRRFFVSGHIDLTEAEFLEHYAPKLFAAAQQEGAEFVVGDAPGCDALTQVWLLGYNKIREVRGLGPPMKVTVHHMLEQPRSFAGHGQLVGGFPDDEARDAAMTAASDTDIAWVRHGKSKNCGTAKNLRRRSDVRHKQECAERAAHPRFHVYEDWIDIEVLRVEPVGDSSSSLRSPDQAIPLPQELYDRLQAARRKASEADQEVTAIEREVMFWRAKQEVEPV